LRFRLGMRLESQRKDRGRSVRYWKRNPDNLIAQSTNNPMTQ